MWTAPRPRPPQVTGEPESDIALIKTYPGINPVLLATAADAGARGIVLEGTGQGNVPASLLTTINDLTDWGIPVVVASRCRTRDVRLGDLPRDIGLAGQVGAIGARGLAPGKARSALMVALGTAGGMAGVRDWFDQLRVGRNRQSPPKPCSVRIGRGQRRGCARDPEGLLRKTGTRDVGAGPGAAYRLQDLSPHQVP